MSVTIRNIFSLLAGYNTANFPVQLIFMICGVIAVYFLFNRKLEKNLLIGAVLTFLWIWMVIVYHIIYFNGLPPGAIVFGILFLAQGIFFFLESFQDKNLIFILKNNFKSYIALFLIIYGLIIYPLINHVINGTLSGFWTLGLPAPTIIMTFGFLMLTGKRFPRYLLIIPTFLAIIGSATALYHELYQDILLLIAAVSANFYLMPKRLFREAETISIR